MNNKTCCFTGHRTKDLPRDIKDLKRALYQSIEDLIKEGVTNFIAGGAIGFDTMAAPAVIDFRQINKKIKLSLYLPCKNQDLRWSEFEKEIYRLICEGADEVIYVSEQYFSGCMHKRNRAMVDKSDYCIAYLCKADGGTFYTVNYAKDKGIPIINLAEIQ